MNGIVSAYSGTPVFKIGIEREPEDAFKFCEALKEFIKKEKNIDVWIGSTYDPFSMRTVVTVIQDRFITIDRCESHFVNGEWAYNFTSDVYPNPDQKVLCTFYIEPVPYLKSGEEIFEELLRHIFPPEPEPEKVGDAIIALKCPCCGGSVNYKNMTCDYCGTKVLYKIKED